MDCNTIRVRKKHLVPNLLNFFKKTDIINSNYNFLGGVGYGKFIFEGAEFIEKLYIRFRYVKL